jgi:comEA protein
VADTRATAVSSAATPVARCRLQDDSVRLIVTTATSGVIFFAHPQPRSRTGDRRFPISRIDSGFRRRVPFAAAGPSLASVGRDPGHLRGREDLTSSPRSSEGATRVPINKEDSMIRSVCSIALLASLLAVVPCTSFAQTKPSSRSTGAARIAPGAIVNINTASAGELDALPGIGAKTAALIVEYRQKNGPFKKVEDLMNVRGVGEKNFLKLKAQITVGAAKSDHDRPNP